MGDGGGDDDESSHDGDGDAMLVMMAMSVGDASIPGVSDCAAARAALARSPNIAPLLEDFKCGETFAKYHTGACVSVQNTHMIMLQENRVMRCQCDRGRHSCVGARR